MKKLMMFVPILIFLVFMFVGSRLFTSGTTSPMTMVLLMALPLGLLLLMKPKARGPKLASDLEKLARGEFAKDAFANDPKLEAMFLGAIKDYNSSMPKAALNKFTKLAALCTDEKDIYAVSMATAQCHLTLGKPLPAIREYTRALGLHPTTEVAMELGSCHQRLGNLDKARDSYEFALDLDATNLEAHSRIATTHVADGNYHAALKQAELVLDADEHHASALATTAICYGLLDDPIMSKRYKELAVENGYSAKKIDETIAALEKR